MQSGLSKIRNPVTKIKFQFAKIFGLNCLEAKSDTIKIRTDVYMLLQKCKIIIKKIKDIKLVLRHEMSAHNVVKSGVHSAAMLLKITFFFISFRRNPVANKILLFVFDNKPTSISRYHGRWGESFEAIRDRFARAVQIMLGIIEILAVENVS